MYNIKEIKQRYTCVDVAKLCGLAIRRAGDRIASPLRPGADNKTAFVVEEEFFYDFVSGVIVSTYSLLLNITATRVLLFVS